MPALPRNLFTLRFSIRSMLVVVTIACVFIGWRANRLFQNQRAIKSLQERKGLSVQYFDANGSHHELTFWTCVNVHKIYLSSEDFIGDEYYQVTPEVWSDLSQLVPLDSINISYTTLINPDQSMHHWNRSSTATEVGFYQCKFHEGGFENFVDQVPMLKALEIDGCTLDSRSLISLSKCVHLESLHLSTASLPANTIATIEGKQLRYLYLSGNVSSDQPEQRIELSPKDLKAIVAMENLKELTIYGQPGFPIRELALLRKCKKLKVLYIDLGDISEADLELAKRNLAEWLPNCEVLLERRTVQKSRIGGTRI